MHPRRTGNYNGQISPSGALHKGGGSSDRPAAQAQRGALQRPALPEAQELADATSQHPFLYELDPTAARKVLDDLQAAPVDKLPVDEEWVSVPAAVGDVRVRIVKPQGATGTLPVVLYMHGGGWVLGNAGAHDRLVRELAVGARAAVAFVKGLDAQRMAVAGESVGGNMTAALALMAKERGDVTFVQQSMYYPVTDAAMNTGSYDQFATGYYLSRKLMEWFWDAYTTDPNQRAEITASPNHATIEQLSGLPPALLIVDEADVLRDEGEAYAAKLRAADVPVTTVRYDGTVHDFMMLNSLSHSKAARGAIDQATTFLRNALGTDQA